MIRLISGPADMAWLQETTRIDCVGYGSAVISGNEDCPERVDLYRSANPVIRDTPSTWWLRGDLECYSKTPPPMLIQLGESIDTVIDRLVKA